MPLRMRFFASCEGIFLLRQHRVPSTENDAAFRRVVAASFIGTVIEWYDFYLYGTAAALVFEKLFFPTFDHFTGQLASFATFAIGFFARPLGGVFFGHFGDRIGRKAMLIATLMLMGLSTFLIGALPTYQQIGVAAPVLLVVLRFIQGFAVGGEWGGAVLMVVEHGNDRGRGFYGSLSQSGTSVGLLLSIGVFSLVSRLPEMSFLAWGWRVPFLFGIILMIVGFVIRLQVEESPLFAEIQAAAQKQSGKKTWPLLEAIRQAPRSVAVILCARVAENSCSYIFTVFLISYATEQLGFARQSVLNAVMTASTLGIITIPLMGYISDRFGRRRVYMVGAALMALSAFPFFHLLEKRELIYVYFVIVTSFSVYVAMMFAPQAAFFTELFGTNVRYSGASLGYQLAAALGGGLAPLIATRLLKATGGKPWPIALYLVILAGIGITAVYFARETSRASLSANAPPEKIETLPLAEA
jgi:MHS family shikimate/dehydroshikimate transporter-like MFS transporter